LTIYVKNASTAQKLSHNETLDFKLSFGFCILDDDLPQLSGLDIEYLSNQETLS
jgi:hypothetical protein